MIAASERLESKGLLSSVRTKGTDTRRVFTVTQAGARALADTKAMRERLWADVELRALLRNA